MDYIAISGGDIERLTNAFRKDYCDRADRRPLDGCVVAGCNNLAKGFYREYILYNIQAGPGPNTVAISPLS